MKNALAILALLLTSALDCLAQGTTYSKFYLDAAPGSYIGYNNNYGGAGPLRINEADGYYWFSSAPTSGSSLHVGIGHDVYGGWRFDFVSPNSEAIVVGKTYENAERWPFNSASPGLNFTSPGRGNNTLTGSFTVRELNYDSTSGKVNSAAVDFIQFDEKISAWWNVGELRYNSDVPMAIPEPGFVAFLITGGLTALFRRRRKN